MNKIFEICKFQPENLKRLHEIREAAFKPVFQSFRDIVGAEIAAVALSTAEKEQSELLDQICKPVSTHDLFVVKDNGVIVGFCSVSLNQETKTGEIDLNAVDPNHQSKGVGAFMYKHAINYMREAGMLVATVGTGGDPSHAPARRAYEKAGFGPAIPSVYMYKKI
ncbi:MAG: GNAT family N-acetyltransferase [Hyphococcus sp.]|nr:MAG: GNAT family N-acetyltransferase [Marinicaulis sp.]